MLGNRSAFEKEWKMVSISWPDFQWEQKQLKHAGVDNEEGRFNKLYDDAFDRKAKIEMEVQAKLKQEEEDAIQMS